ncbi:hypothetical protein J6S88_01475 [bacterium]|nr:hypothetical protein [bacterium]
MPIPIDAIKPKPIKNYDFARRLIRGVGTGALLPVIGLECFVTGGRTVQSTKRGGFDEGRERFTEEFIGALFWFGGVKLFNRMNDFIGSKLLKLVNSKFDVGQDAVRDPLVNYIEEYGKDKVKDGKVLRKANKLVNETSIAIFKFAKVAASVILANVLVGFVVPKINQRITVNLHNKREAKKNQAIEEAKAQILGQNEQEKDKTIAYEDTLELQNSDKKQQDKDVKFGAANGFAQSLLTLANHLEHDNVYQLLSTDLGITTGRTINSRNNHERVEVMFRDLSSIYFYMFAIGHIDSLLNLIEDGSTTRIDPVASQQVVDQLKLAFEADVKSGKIKPEDLRKLAFGEEENMKYFTNEINDLFGKKGVANLDEFIRLLENNESIPKSVRNEFISRAKAMSKLQPDIAGISKITKDQAEKLFKGGALNMAEFLDNLYGLASNNEMFGSSLDYAHKNPFGFVSHRSLLSKENEMQVFIEQIIKKAKKEGVDITIDFIEKFDRANMRKAGLNRFVGFAISALFLSTLIPKIQFWITKVTTGKNSFPGMTDYSDEKNAQKAA